MVIYSQFIKGYFRSVKNDLVIIVCGRDVRSHVLDNSGRIFFMFFFELEKWFIGIAFVVNNTDHVVKV